MLGKSFVAMCTAIDAMFVDMMAHGFCGGDGSAVNIYYVVWLSMTYYVQAHAITAYLQSQSLSGWNKARGYQHWKNRHSGHPRMEE
eukprot:scaffold40490_cov18-Prasinocladus_malaysianus.AAC.2